MGDYSSFNQNAYSFELIYASYSASKLIELVKSRGLMRGRGTKGKLNRCYGFFFGRSMGLKEGLGSGQRKA